MAHAAVPCLLDIGRGSREGAISLEASIKNCGRRKQWSEALRFLREGVRFGEQLAPSHYIATVSACRKGGQWQHALSVLSEMWEAKLEPNVISYSAGISACEKGEQWQRALALLSEMLEATVEPDVITTMLGSARAGRASSGNGPWRCSARRGRRSRVPTRQLQRWDQRVREGRSVAAGSGVAQQDAGGEAGAQLSYNAGISACEKGDQWQRALALLSEMWEAKLEPVVISSASTLGSAHARKASSGSWRWRC
ncbi:unnamed protein product [Prorocentrum cordatum]|uniref:Pentatricopeptide repeat-containing protein, chloroplastic n=1 Tax=Prorocentrum cordatum TaxID=2364126 RepID=A0ABN9S2A5_9DINO|nr:unnamed protein product [Polarella glacialis]